MVECDLAKVEVAGSNPVSRSKIIPGTSSPCRFDVVAIDGVGDEATVTYYRSAFATS